MCSYCDKDMSFGNLALISWNNLEVYIAKGVLKVEQEKGTSNVKICFCPMCGENLEED